MRRTTAECLLLAVLALAGATTGSAQGSSAPGPSSAALTRIAFGSCFRTDRPDHVWGHIAELEPELTLLLGDNVYADTSDEDTLRRAYAALAAVPGFAALRAQGPLLATWDDHDYGLNDGGAAFTARAMSQRVFLEFFEVPQSDVRHRRPGIYHAQRFGPPGRCVQVILLDTRYFRAAFERRERSGILGDGLAGHYRPSRDPLRSMLGEAQWTWLGERLREPADLRLVVSSIQVVSEDHGFESWSRLPLERARLLALIAECEAEGVVILSGDRHMAELSVLDLGRAADGSAVDVGYPLVDVTASSLNVPLPFNNSINRHRLGSPYYGANFGFLEIDWGAPTPRLEITVRSDRGEVVLRHALELSELRRP